MNLLQLLNDRNAADKEKIHLTTDGKKWEILPVSVNEDKYYYQERPHQKGFQWSEVYHIYRFNKLFVQATIIKLKDGKVETIIDHTGKTAKTIEEKMQFFSGILNLESLSKIICTEDFSRRKPTTKHEVDVMFNIFHRRMFMRPMPTDNEIETYFSKFPNEFFKISF